VLYLLLTPPRHQGSTPSSLFGPYSKVEVARLNDKAAEKQLKCKMLDTYRELLLAQTTNLSAHALTEREKALESIRLVLFATDN
jgi:hypothetical protein